MPFRNLYSKKSDDLTPSEHHESFQKHGLRHGFSSETNASHIHMYIPGSYDKGSDTHKLVKHLRSKGYQATNYAHPNDSAAGSYSDSNTMLRHPKSNDMVLVHHTDDGAATHIKFKDTSKIKESLDHEFLKKVNELFACKDEKEIKERTEEMAHSLLETETEAAASLHPAAKPLADPPSKAEMIAKMLGAAATMKSDELTKFYTDMLAQIGHEADSTPAAAEKNRASVAMKGSAVGAYKEDVESLFAGQELDEEFKAKATVILESAVQAKLIVELARIEEETNVKLEEKVKELDEDFTKKMEAYLDTSASKWLEENKVAIESALRNEIIEGFIDGMKNLFKEHYVEIPEEKVDVIGELSEKVEELEGRLSEALTSNKELADRMTESSKGEVITSVSAGLVMTDVENFKKMTETVEFVDVEDYKTKLLAVREAHFTKKPVGNISLNETDEGTTEEVELDPMMARYVKAISMTTKR